MTQAADLIDYLLARRPGRFLLERRSGLPYGWSAWIRSLPVAAAGFDAGGLTASAAARRPRPTTGIAPRLGWLQAFRQLWWQQWEPRPRDQRRIHWLSVSGSALLHLLFAALLLWVAIVQWARPDTDAGDEGRVQLAFLGRGTPTEGGGGGGAPAAQPTPPAATGAASATAPAATRPASVEASAPPLPERASAPPDAADAPTPADAPAAEAVPLARQRPEPVAQASPAPMVIDPAPLQVTETPVPTSDFVLPPPPQLAVPLREVTLPPAQVHEREVEALTAQPQVPQVQARATVAPRMPMAEAPAVREREVVEVPRPSSAQLRIRTRELQPNVAMPDLTVRQAELPDVAAPAVPAPAPAPPSRAPAAPPTSAPQPSPTSATATATPAAAPASAATAAPAPAATPAPGAGPAARPGSGPVAADRRDGWSSPQRGDDWSVGTHDQGGARASTAARDGLFNGDGSVRLHDGDGQAAASAAPRGAPGSDTDSWSRDRIAQSGTWLKRPPYDYTPTSFDQYWVPSESLLEEWVRKGIKSIEIAIPGTSTRISCVVSLLQFGGGCGLTDPNKNDQPAQARPPPDIPFKKDLQEDNGALR